MLALIFLTILHVNISQADRIFVSMVNAYKDIYVWSMCIIYKIAIANLLLGGIYDYFYGIL